MIYKLNTIIMENHKYWWEDEKNKHDFEFPVSVVNESGVWVATCNENTKVLLGDKVHACAQGNTKDEAIRKMFSMIRFMHEYSDECRMNYQRFVPFRKGDWSQTGGKWFVIFGINFYFRYGSKMKHGWYFPFTKLNISINNEWVEYSRLKKNKYKI
jgi:hypothetical protein